MTEYDRIVAQRDFFAEMLRKQSDDMREAAEGFVNTLRLFAHDLAANEPYETLRIKLESTITAIENMLALATKDPVTAAQVVGAVQRGEVETDAIVSVMGGAAALQLGHYVPPGTSTIDAELMAAAEDLSSACERCKQVVAVDTAVVLCRSCAGADSHG